LLVGTFVLLLVAGIVISLRKRRAAARAVDPAADTRTPLVDPAPDTRTPLVDPAPGVRTLLYID
jgi:hypothetical protein